MKKFCIFSGIISVCPAYSETEYPKIFHRLDEIIDRFSETKTLKSYIDENDNAVCRFEMAGELDSPSAREIMKPIFDMAAALDYARVFVSCADSDCRDELTYDLRRGKVAIHESRTLYGQKGMERLFCLMEPL